MVSSELPEVLGISDRILVMSHGHQRELLETAKTNQVEVMRYAVQQGARSAAGKGGMS